MIAYIIKDVKQFIKKLLADNETAFDQFLFCEATINTFATFNIDGHLNKAFYTSEELTEMENTLTEEGRIFSQKMVRWEAIKNTCFQIIKGKKTPTSFKIILYLSDENIKKFLSGIDTAFTPADIDGLSLIIKYDEGVLTCTSSASMHIFTMDRTIEHSWDKMVDKFLNSLNIRYEQL